jgi:hypothetical protein
VTLGISLLVCRTTFGTMRSILQTISTSKLHYTLGYHWQKLVVTGATSCIKTTGTGKETIEHSIDYGVAEYNKWVQQPDNVSQQNKDDKMIPYLKHQFIYINFAKSMYHMGSGKVTNLPSCVFEFIRDTIPDKQGFTEDGHFNFMATRVL